MKTIQRLLILALLATAQLAPAAAPAAVNYQGRFTNAAGVPEPGVKAMSLKIYDAPNDGIPLYSETVGNVAIDANGVYRFQFGASGAGTPASLANALAASSEQWMELAVDGVPQAPRQKILAVPFALMASALPDGAVSSAMIADGAVNYEDLSTTVTDSLAAGLALPANSTKGVIVTTATGVRTAYPPSADTDAARGMALEAAFAAAAPGDTIDLNPGNYLVAKSVSTIGGYVAQYAILDKMTIRLNGARLYKQSSNTPSAMFCMNTTAGGLGPNDWSIIGPGILEGCAASTGGVVAEIGVDVRACRRWRIDNVTMIKFRGTGLQLNNANFTGDPLGYLPNKTATGHVVGCHFDLNNIGMSCYAGNEYTSFSNCTFNANLTGADIYAGNTKFIGCEASGNTNFALRIRNGGNDGHGCWVGGWITHNAGFAIAAEANMDNGFLFTGATIAGDGLTSNKIQSLGGGLTFTGCFFDSPIYASATPTGINTVQGCFIAGTYAAITDLSTAERAKWKFRENHTLTGSWARNDPPSSNLASYADNAAALAGGLIPGDMYMVIDSDPRQIAITY